MPFLRRRGIMTNESEMRHQLMAPDTSSLTSNSQDKSVSEKSQAIPSAPVTTPDNSNHHLIPLQQQLLLQQQQQQLMAAATIYATTPPKPHYASHKQPANSASAAIAASVATSSTISSTTTSTPTIAAIAAASIAAVTPSRTFSHLYAQSQSPNQPQQESHSPDQSTDNRDIDPVESLPVQDQPADANSTSTVDPVNGTTKTEEDNTQVPVEAKEDSHDDNVSTPIATPLCETPPNFNQFTAQIYDSPTQRPKTPSQKPLPGSESPLNVTPNRATPDLHNVEDPERTPVANPPSTAIRRSHDLSQAPRETRNVTENSSKYRRFSLRFRNASDSQLSLRMKQLEEPPPPPIPIPPPDIITTAPTVEFTAAMQKKPSRLRLSRFRPAKNTPSATPANPITASSAAGTSAAGLSSVPGPSTTPGQAHRTSARASSSAAVLEANGTLQNNFHSRVSIDTHSNLSSSPARAPSTTDDHDMAPDGSFFSLTPHRRSTSSRPSDVSIADGRPHITQRSTSIFRLPRRKPKTPESFFPLGHLPQRPKLSTGDDSHFEADGINSLAVPGTADDLSISPLSDRPMSKDSPNTPRPGSVRSKTATPNISPSPVAALIRPPSTHSGRSSPTRSNRRRGRSSTLSSLGHDSNDEHLVAPNSRPSFTSGRKSFGDLFGLGRLRQNSDLTVGRSGNLTPATPGSIPSKNNSLQLVREEVSLPERRDEDTPVKYLARVEEVVPRGSIASVLSKNSDTFSASVLRSYMRKFSFFGDPMDMALRKLLMEAELPKETQQIDRCLQAFANRYHECNPGIYANPDQAYFVAFSLLILHTDVFNKNNKHKMQKADYLKNTRNEGVYDDILDCFYDNITYTPFIHVEDDDSSSDRNSQGKGRRRPIFPGAPPELPTKKSKEPIDPYTLILDGKLDTLRPNFKDVMTVDDNYNYLGSASSLDLKELQKTFFRTGVLQIVSARSRPDAFMTEKTASNPQVAHPGIVDIKVTKVGLLWRKDAKKKKTRSPWQEWGAILTGAQLYFFRNTTWVKSLMHQYESHTKQGNDDVPVIFKPPLDQFKPDALMSTDGAVALHDTSYKKHKHAFVYIRHGGFEEVLLADDEDEMNDWLAKLNYAAAFKTSGVRMRGVVGANYDGQNRRAIRRLDSADGAQVVQTPSGEVSITRGKIDHKMAEDISAARRQIIVDKVAEADERLHVSQKLLDLQLRNARHLQIMAPIQAKTREQVLLSAARMSAQLKWTRAEIWRLKCHRDILLQDMEEEHMTSMRSGSLSLGVVTEDSVLSKEPSRPGSSTSLEERLDKTITPGSSHGPPALSLASSPHEAEPSLAGDDECPESEDEEAFTTPPTSAPFQVRPGSNPIHNTRKPSVVSMKSSQGAPSTIASPQMGPSAPEASNKDANEHDIVEHDLLEQAGLLRSSTARNRISTGSNAQFGAIDVDPDKEKADRSKIRRSLQRTLREGGTRTKKGKEPVPLEYEDERLARGTGSFTVHGKKASVINFGSELQNLPSKRTESELPLSPTGLSVVEDDDFHSAIGDFEDWRERRGSAASASTATARSFRELHRKYSTTNGPRAHSTPGNGRLTVPSDTESEFALSFSDGRRTPLPPIENGSDEELAPHELGLGEEALAQVSDALLGSEAGQTDDGQSENGGDNLTRASTSVIGA